MVLGTITNRLTNIISRLPRCSFGWDHVQLLIIVAEMWLVNDRFTNNDSGGRLIQPRLLCKLVRTWFGRDD